MDITRRNFLFFGAALTGAGLTGGISQAVAAANGQADDSIHGQKRPIVAMAHFSPNGSTAKIAGHFSQALSAQIKEYDLTGQDLQQHSFAENMLAVVAVPVYMGRVPARAVAAIRLLAGNAAACVSFVVYGNRAIDDSLIELNDLLTQQGFKVIASGAFIGQHALASEIAAGRPDAQDLAELAQFASAVKKMITSAAKPEPPQVPGKRPYVNLPAPAMTPVTTDDCINCGLCADRCPVSAIPQDNFKSTSPEKCMLCMRCVHSCPKAARTLPPQFAEKLATYMQKYKARQEPQTYL